MAKDEGWVDDDPTVPAGWRTKEYVNKGIGTNVISFSDFGSRQNLLYDDLIFKYNEI